MASVLFLPFSFHSSFSQGGAFFYIIPSGVPWHVALWLVAKSITLDLPTMLDFLCPMSLWFNFRNDKDNCHFHCSSLFFQYVTSILLIDLCKYRIVKLFLVRLGEKLPYKSWIQEETLEFVGRQFGPGERVSHLESEDQGLGEIQPLTMCVAMDNSYLFLDFLT